MYMYMFLYILCFRSLIPTLSLSLSPFLSPYLSPSLSLVSLHTYTYPPIQSLPWCLVHLLFSFILYCRRSGLSTCSTAFLYQLCGRWRLVTPTVCVYICLGGGGGDVCVCVREKEEGGRNGGGNSCVTKYAICIESLSPSLSLPRKSMLMCWYQWVLPGVQWR